MKIHCCFVIPLWNTLADVSSKQLPCSGIDTYFNLLTCLYIFLIPQYGNYDDQYMYNVLLLFCPQIYCTVSVKLMSRSVFSHFFTFLNFDKLNIWSLKSVLHQQFTTYYIVQLGLLCYSQFSSVQFFDEKKSFYMQFCIQNQNFCLSSQPVSMLHNYLQQHGLAPFKTVINPIFSVSQQ